MDNFDLDNEIIEIGSDETIEPVKEDINEIINDNEKKENIDIETVKVKTKKNKNKKSLKDKWNDLSKKNKIIIIVVSIIVLLAIIGTVLYFIVFKKDKNPNEVIDSVVIEKDNYRYEDGKLIFLDKSDKEIGTYECSVKDSTKCYVAKNDYSTDKFERIISVNEKDEEIEKNSQIYLNKFVFVTDDDETNLYNIKSKENELKVKSIKSYNTDENLVVVEDENSKYGLIDITSDGYKYLIKSSYDNLGIVNTKLNYLVAQDKDSYYILDSTGKKLSSNLNTTVQSVSEDYIVGLKNKTYNLYTYEYEEVESDYDYISLHDNVIALVNQSQTYNGTVIERALFLRKHHLEGILVFFRET